MPRYVTPDVVEQARKVDLLSYFQATAPNELVRCGAEEYCTRDFDKDKSHVQSVVDSMAENKKFNPILCWKYTPLSACEVVMEEADYGIRHNSLFPCGGKLIAERTNDATENFGFVYDRNELWLLRNMTFAVTRSITYGNCEGERMTYRYFIGNDLDCFRKYCEADDILARVRELIRENESQFEV